MTSHWLAFRASYGRLIVAGGVATVIAIGMASWAVSAQQSATSTQLEASPLQQGVCLGFGAAESARHAATGAMRFIGTRAGNPMGHPLQQGAGTPPETAARSYLSVCGSMFGLSGDAAELALQRVTPAENQRSVIRFQQMFGGLPVFGGEMVVQLDANRNVVATTGRVLPRLKLATRPTVTTADARNAALQVVGRAHNVPIQELSAGTPELWIYSETLVGPGQGPARLVWRIEVTPTELRPIRELVLVDATRGNVALHFNQVDTARQRQTHTANNGTTLPGTLVCDESNPTCAGGDAHAAAAHLNAGDTYDFYLANHGRDGITGTGSVIRSTVHYSVGYDNAFWNGTQMVYGDAAGFPLADDVVAHELTHGVTQYTSRLYYYYQSGAINESFSDLWGEFVDQTNGRGNDSSGVRWLMGEDVSGLGAIRSMSSPPLYGSPDRMRSVLYYLGEDDNGGVHVNSGINNKAAYLMVDGGTFNGQTVQPLGIIKTAKIYYEAQTNLLTSGSDYEDLYNALFQACQNLVGTSNIFAADCDEVRKATLAVEMNLQPIAGFNVEAPLCAAGEAPTSVFFDDLETSSANFSAMVAAGTSRWVYTTSFAHSGQRALYGNDAPAAVSDSSIAMTSSVTVPSNGFLHFAHAYGFENPAYDGGVVEYTINGGASWFDAGGLFDNGGYTGTIVSGSGNLLGGRAAFIGDSHGFVASRLNLSSLAGQSVRFRWRMSIDDVVFDRGWWVDDVRIYSCAVPSVPPGVPQSPAPANAATGVFTNQGLTWSATGAATYDIAFGTANPPPQAATALTVANFTPALAANTTYFWRVTANNGAGATPGPVWTFTTGAVPTDLLVTDTFTGAGSLTSHTPDLNVSGAPWIVSGGPPTPTLTGGLVGVTTGTGHLQATLQTAAADIRMSVDYRVGAGAQQLAGLAFRFTDVNNHLLLLFYDNALHFYRRQNGAFVLLVSSPGLAPVAAGSTQRLEVRTAGSTLTGWWNGVQVVQTVDTFQQTATRHGLDWNASFDPAARFDNLEIRSPVTMPVTPPSAPATPSPANAATGVATSTPLTWTSAGAATYDVAFGTVSPPPALVAGLSNASYSPTMAGNTTYYWQVTARNTAGSTAGPVWSFTTAALPADLLVTDTFTGTGLLTSHTPDVNVSGAPWTVTAGPPIPIVGSGVVAISPGSGHVQATLQTAATDIRMGADIKVGASGQRLAGLAFRLTDANNHLLLLFYENALHFYLRQNGTYSLLASSGPLAPVAGGSTQRIEVRTNGTALTGWWNGAQVVQAVDTIQQTATRHGLDWNASFDSETRFDNLEIRNNGTPVAPPGVPGTPSPANAASGVATSATLAWSATGATSYDIAFGTVNPPPWVATGLSTASYAPTLAGTTTYYWQVIARNASGSTAGPVWSFTTATPPNDLLVSDAFTGTAGTLLTTHAPDVNVGGAPWNVTGGPPTPTLASGTVGVSAGTGHVQATLQTGAPDIRMSVDYRVGASPQRLAGFAFRLTDVNNHLLLLFYDNALHFYRRQNGVYALLASSAGLATPAVGTAYRLEVRTAGSALTGWWNGVQVVQATDDLQQTATRHGLDWNTAFDTTATFDNLEIRNAGAPVSPPGVPGTPSPSNTATGVATNATMSWNATGATSYDVAFGTVNPPSTVTTGQGATTYTPPAMTNSTTYYWQVTARNAGGTTAGPVWSFTTASPPPAPGIPATPSPADGAAGVPFTTALTWNASGAATYDIAFGTANPPPSVATGLTSATYSPAMGSNTTYFWRVTARNGGGSTVGPLWTFTTASLGDLLVLDAFTGSGALTSHVPDLNLNGGPWSVTGGPPTPTLAGGVVGITTGTTHVQATLQTNVADIRMGVDYRVGASSQRLAGLAFRLMDVDNHLLLLFYENALHFYRRQSGAYVWLASSGALAPVAGGSTHRMEVRTAGSVLTGWWDGVQVVQASEIFLQSATRHGLDWNPSLDVAATFDDLEIRNASVPVAPGVPASPSPGNTATGVATNATLSWSAAAATSYDVRFGTVTPPPLVSAGQGGATYTPTLAAATTYFWQVTARNTGGTTTGPVWTFTTAAPLPAPSAPVLIGPPNGETGIWINAPLTWSSTGATSYDLAFGTVNPPAPLVAGLTSATYSPPTAINTTYFWRVTARNAAGSTTGPVWTFDTNVPPNLIVRDRFTGASGAPLAVHAPEINLPGSAWSITGSPTSPTLINGRAGATVGTQHVQATLLIGIPDVEMAVDYYPGASQQPLAGLVFRFIDESNHYLLLYFQNALHFYQRSAGTYTLLSSSPPLTPVVPGNGYRLGVRASGTQLSGWWNGLPVVQATASSPTGGSRYGLDWNPIVDSTATFDSLEIINIGALPPLPGAPATPSPANGATGVIPGIPLQWSSTDAVTYDVAIGTALPLPVLATGLTSPTVMLSPSLPPNTQYFWQVTARNGHGSTTGPVWSFTTAPAAPPVPAIPTIVAPADGSTGFPVIAFMQWSSSGASTYDVAFGTVSPPPAWATGLTSPLASPAMFPNTKYYWRVTARNANGSTTGPIWSFTTAGPAPQLLASDTFTGADGTLLSAHTPDVGGGVWSITGAPPFPTLNGGFVGVTAGTTQTQATLSLGMQVNMRMAVDYRVGTGTSHTAGLVFRFIDQNNFLVLLFNQNASLNELQFLRRQGGVTTLFAYSPPLPRVTAGTTHRLEVRASGGVLTGFWNGVPVVQSSDSNFVTGTRFGLNWSPSVDSTATFDNLEIYNMGVP